MSEQKSTKRRRLLHPGSGQRPPPLQAPADLDDWYGEKKKNRKATPAPTRRRPAPRVRKLKKNNRQRLLHPGNGQRPPPLQTPADLDDWYGEKKKNRKATPTPTRRRPAPRVRNPKKSNRRPVQHRMTK